MPNYRTTELPEGIRVGKIMSFFTTRFDCGTLVKNRRETYPFWAMIYTLGGNMTFQIGEETYRVGAGELIFTLQTCPIRLLMRESACGRCLLLRLKVKAPKCRRWQGKSCFPMRRWQTEYAAFFVLVDVFSIIFRQRIQARLECIATPTSLKK